MFPPKPIIRVNCLPLWPLAPLRLFRNIICSIGYVCITGISYVIFFVFKATNCIYKLKYECRGNSRSEQRGIWCKFPPLQEYGIALLESQSLIQFRSSKDPTTYCLSRFVRVFLELKVTKPRTVSSRCLHILNEMVNKTRVPGVPFGQERYLRMAFGPPLPTSANGNRVFCKAITANYVRGAIFAINFPRPADIRKKAFETKLLVERTNRGRSRGR